MRENDSSRRGRDTLLRYHGSLTEDRSYRVLLVEDDPGDARLIRDLLAEDGTDRDGIHDVGTLARAAILAERGEWDVVFLDLALPDSEGIETLHRLRERAPGLPIVVLGLDDEHLARAAVRAGAQDYLVKSKVDARRLSHAVRCAVERNLAKRRLEGAEAAYRGLFDEAPVMHVITQDLGSGPVVTDCSRLFLETLGYDRGEVLGRPLRAFYVDADTDEHAEERRLVARNGKIVETLFRAASGPGADGSGSRAMFLDITERKQAEEALRASEAKTRALVDAIPDLILRIRADGSYSETKIPRDFAALVRGAESGSRTVFGVLPTKLAESCLLAARLALESGEIQVMECELPENSVTRHYEARLVPAGGGEALAIVREVTGRKELEEQLRQSQKMEAVGRLAGGLAHDFNNMLTAIAGYSELLLMDLPPEDPRRSDVAEIKKSAARAADLTRQLLAFSRRQVLRPRVIDPNRIVADLLKLLRRLISENIELRMNLDPALGCIKADPAQIEQILINLALNARDAMPGGGTLVIETKEALLDDASISLGPNVKAGRYAMLSVSDSGHGIPKTVQSKIFEPFFTTKDAGSGTGLGLATVYGIVRQSGGYIWVYSEAGLGTTFKVYLPRTDAKESHWLDLEREPGEVAGRHAKNGPSERILLVEDDDTVRGLASRVLRDRGYGVVEARDGREGIRLFDELGETIDLLLTDVVMPNASGPEIAEALRRKRSRMKVLYMSGYTENGLVMQTLASDAPFLQKPFSASGLASKVREVLDA